MRIKKAMTYWIYSFTLSLILLICVQKFLLKDFYQLNYVGGFLLGAFIDFFIILGLYDNVPSERMKQKLEKIKKIFKDNSKSIT